MAGLGGFSLAFAGLILWFICNLSFLSLLLKLMATPLAIISHLGVLSFISQQTGAHSLSAKAYELCTCYI